MSLVLQEVEKFYIPTIEKTLHKENLLYHDANAENIEFYMMSATILKEQNLGR